MSSEKIAEYIETLAAKLGVAAEHVYGVLVRQAFVDGVRGVIFAIVLAGVSYLMFRITTRVIRSEDEAFAIFPIAAFVITLVMALVFMYNGIGQLINPEYYAIREILDVVGGGR